MRRFNFRFQRVLEIKGRVEDARKAALGDAVGAAEAERRELDRLRVLRQNQIAAARPAGGQVIDPGLLRLQSDYTRRLEREQGEQSEQLRLASALVDEKREHLMEATRERRVFEILRERAAAAHKKVAQRQELAALDEVGGQLHLRRQRAVAQRVRRERTGERDGPTDGEPHNEPTEEIA